LGFEVCCVAVIWPGDACWAFNVGIAATTTQINERKAFVMIR
jgi:hypothetical protein